MSLYFILLKLDNPTVHCCDYLGGGSSYYRLIIPDTFESNHDGI